MRKILLLSLVLSCRFLFSQSIIYVNHAATGANDGSSWADAYTDFQSALDSALAGDQIWVAKGVYKPSRYIDSSLAPYHPRTVTFRLVDSVGHYGGFDGTETSLSQRDWEG